MVIAGFIHPVILLLLFGLSVIGAFCNSLPDWYENKIRDENARDEMTMQYIDRLSDDAISGKDIRVFGLKKWIIGKYGIAIKNTRRRNAKKNIIAFAGKSLETILTAGRDLIWGENPSVMSLTTGSSAGAGSGSGTGTGSASGTGAGTTVSVLAFLSRFLLSSRRSHPFR